MSTDTLVMLLKSKQSKTGQNNNALKQFRFGHQLGMTLVEILAALAVMALIGAGLMSWIDTFQRSMRSQTAGGQWSAVMTHGKLVASTFIAGELLGVDGSPLVVNASNVAIALPLPNAQIAMQQAPRFKDMNGFGQSACWVAEWQADNSVQMTVLGVGGQVMRELDLAEAIAVAGPLAGSLNTQGTTLRVSSYHWARSLSPAVVQAVKASCPLAQGEIGTGRLAGIIPIDTVATQANGQSLYRVAIQDATRCTLENGVNVCEVNTDLNTMRHDLKVKNGDFVIGAPVQSVGVDCVVGNIARTSVGLGLECVQPAAGSTPKWSVLPNAGKSIAATFVGVTEMASAANQASVGFVLGVLGQREAQNGVESCARLGEMRRNAEGGIVACQAQQGASQNFMWKQQGGAFIKWTILDQPVSLLTPLSPIEGVVNIKDGLIKDYPDLNPDKIRLVKVRFRNLYAAQASNRDPSNSDTATPVVCSQFVSVSTAVPGDYDLIANPDKVCTYNFSISRASDGVQARDTVKNDFKLEVTGYLCDSEDCK